jgi:hypothetical protein
MSKNNDPKNVSLSFTKGTLYQDMRFLGKNAYRDMKMSLIMGTSSDVVHYLKPHSKLLKPFNGNEEAELITKGIFSAVYIMKDHEGHELIVKRSHDGWIPIQLYRNVYLPMPHYVVQFFAPDYAISARSLRRDVYDYEEVLKPVWGPKRISITGSKMAPYLNMALHLVDNFIPLFEVNDLYKLRFWKRLLERKQHRSLSHIKRYLKSVPTQKSLIPNEERYIFYDRFSNSLQTIFLQEAMKGKKDVIPGKKMAYPFELVSKGYIPDEMPKVMIEHILRTMQSLVMQLKYKKQIPKVPDYRPLESFKIFAPTPFELFFAETPNLIAHKDSKGRLNVSYVDTHFLFEVEGNFTFRWTAKRYWMSLFLNLRFWIKKALSMNT